MSGSPKGLYALDRESWITARCKLVAITFLSPSDFVCNRMWRLVVPISIVVAAVLPGGNPIAVSSLRPFSYHPTISSNRSGSGAQRDSAAGRLPPLSVSAPFTAVRFDWMILAHENRWCVLFSLFLFSPSSPSPLNEKKKEQKGQRWFVDVAIKAFCLDSFMFTKTGKKESRQAVFLTGRIWFSYRATANVL